MATDLSKLAKEMLSFPERKPNGSSAPPAAKPKPVPSCAETMAICGIHNDPATKR